MKIRLNVKIYLHYRKSTFNRRRSVNSDWNKPNSELKLNRVKRNRAIWLKGNLNRTRFSGSLWWSSIQWLTCVVELVEDGGLTEVQFTEVDHVESTRRGVTRVLQALQGRALRRARLRVQHVRNTRCSALALASARLSTASVLAAQSPRAAAAHNRGRVPEITSRGHRGSITEPTRFSVCVSARGASSARCTLRAFLLSQTLPIRVHHVLYTFIPRAARAHVRSLKSYTLAPASSVQDNHAFCCFFTKNNVSFSNLAKKKKKKTCRERWKLWARAVVGSGALEVTTWTQTCARWQSGTFHAHTFSASRAHSSPNFTGILCETPPAFHCVKEERKRRRKRLLFKKKKP